MKSSPFPGNTTMAVEAISKIIEIANADLPSIREKIAYTMSAYEKRDFEEFFFLLGDLERFPVFLVVRRELDDIFYFRILGEALTSECYATDSPDLMRSLLQERPLSSRHHLMDESEQACLAGLPSKIKIYRGVCPGAVNGFSWTLSEEKARFFAKRHLAIGRDAGVFSGSCEKADVVAYFSREEEVFIDPEDVRDIKPIELLHHGKCQGQSNLWKYEKYLKIKEYLISINIMVAPRKPKNRRS